MCDVWRRHSARRVRAAGAGLSACGVVGLCGGLLALAEGPAAARAEASAEPASRPAVAAPAIDEILHHAGWRDGTFGPTGERLFTERIEHGLGARGQFSYIHYAKIMDPIRLQIVQGGRPIGPSEKAADWYPSHLAVSYAAGGLSIAERKFITDDDVLVVLLTISNGAAEPFEGQVVYTSGIAAGRGGPSASFAGLVGSGVFAGVETWAVACGSGFEPAERGGALARRVSLGPGESVALPVALALHEQIGVAHERAQAWLGRPDPLADHRRAYQQWFDENAPGFECDDAVLTTCWAYRLFVMRHCLSRACMGNLKEPYFFEGTHESHFPRLIAFSSPHIIAEARWLRDGRWAWGQVLNHARNRDERCGHFISARADARGGDYNNWIAAAAWGLYAVHPDRARLAEAADAMAADVLGTMRCYDPDGNALPAPRNHGTTGMEYQPAFFYFNDYDDTKPDARLERADFAAYVYANARAVAAARRELGQVEKAEPFEALAYRIRRAAMAKLWDEQDSFFYAVREGDGAVARVREVVGFYPFAFGLAPDEARVAEALRYLVDPAEFWTPFPPATVSRKCPAYTPKPEHWPAAGGRTHGCMWNGPAWPHATSVTLNAVGAALWDSRQDVLRPEHFWHMLDRYAHLHFAGGDPGRPLLREYNHGTTGEGTGCPDYFHSTFCDLVVRYVAGLDPRPEDRLVVRPIPGPLSRFALRRVRYRDRDVAVVYNLGRAGPGEGPAGLSVWVDGRLVARRETLGELSVDLTGHKGLR